MSSTTVSLGGHWLVKPEKSQKAIDKDFSLLLVPWWCLDLVLNLLCERRAILSQFTLRSIADVQVKG